MLVVWHHHPSTGTPDHATVPLTTGCAAQRPRCSLTPLSTPSVSAGDVPSAVRCIHPDRGHAVMNPPRAPRPMERNRLLLALPRTAYRALLPDLEAVILPHGAVLFEARDRITHIYFPQRCVISLLAAAGDGEGVEVGLVGNEGMVGLSVFLGATSSTTQAVLQIPDGAWRMEVGAFRCAVDRQPSLGHVLRRYTQSVISQVTQGLACNQRHAA